MHHETCCQTHVVVPDRASRFWFSSCPPILVFVLTPREIEISGCCRWTRLSTAWLQSWDHSGLNLSKIIGDCCSVWCFWLDSYFFCGHKLRTAWNSLWTLLNCLSNKVSRTNLTILTPCRTHTDMFLHDSNIKWALISPNEDWEDELPTATATVWVEAQVEGSMSPSVWEKFLQARRLNECAL